MESLALLVCILFLFVVSIGPLSYGTSLLPFVPKWIKYVFAIVSMITGLWWLTLPTTGVNMLGLLPIYLGYVSLPKKD